MNGATSRQRLVSSLALLALALTQGCIGGAAVRSHTVTFPNPAVSKTAHADGTHRRGTLTNDLVTAAWLEAHWGKPDRIRRSTAPGVDETWTYTFGPMWEGIVPIAIVPVPILFPTQVRKVQFQVREGRVVEATHNVPQLVGGAVGYSLSPSGGARFGAFSLND